MAFPFEKSKKDKEPRGMREGARKEEKMDSMQMKKHAKGKKSGSGKKC